MGFGVQPRFKAWASGLRERLFPSHAWARCISPRDRCGVEDQKNVTKKYQELSSRNAGMNLKLGSGFRIRNLLGKGGKGPPIA